MIKENLSEQEQVLLQAVEACDYQSDISDSRRQVLAEIAKNTFKKDKRINIRISNRDLQAIQSKATQ